MSSLRVVTLRAKPRIAFLSILALLLSHVSSVPALRGSPTEGVGAPSGLLAAQGGPDVDVTPKKLDVVICPGDRRLEKISVSTTDKRPIDLFLLIDTTRSFASAIRALKNTANQLVVGLQDLRKQLNPDDPNFIRFGLGEFRDYPFEPWGDPRNDYAYRRDLDLTSLSSDEDIAKIMQKINELTTSSGGDTPESQLPALVQAATGAGQDFNDDRDFKDFGEIPDKQGASFREGTRRIIILATDAPFHSPENTPGYFGPTFAETVSILKERGIMVYGLFNDAMTEDSQPAREDILRIARETGAIAAAGGFHCDGDVVPAGQPIVCTLPADGKGIASSIVMLATPGTRTFRVDPPSARPACLVGVSPSQPSSGGSFTVELTCPADGQACQFDLSVVEILAGNVVRQVATVPVTVRCGSTLIIPGPLPPGVVFPPTSINRTATRMVPLQNKGKSDLVVANIQSSTPEFIVRPPLSFTLPPDGVRDITIDFACSNVGDFKGTISVISNACNGSSFNFPVEGKCAQQCLTVSPESVGFGNVLIGDRKCLTVNLINSCIIPFTVTSVRIVDGADFSIPGPPTNPALLFTIPAMGTTTLTVCFAPSVVGPRTGTLTVSGTSADGAQSASAGLTGTGIQPTVRPRISGTGDALILGYYDLERFDMNRFEVINTGAVWLQARIRLREAGQSNDVVNFPIVLSPNDLFFFDLKRDAQGNMFLESNDSGTLNHTEIFVLARAGLVRNVQFDGRTARITPPGGNKLVGYVEVFGEAVFGDRGPGGIFRPFNQPLQPVPGGGFFPGPAGISTFTWAAVRGGVDGNAATQDLGDAPNVLTGEAFLINVMSQFWTKYNAVAIEDFRTTAGEHARNNYPPDPGVILVDDSCLPFPTNGLMGNAFCFPDGDVGARIDDGDGGIANINALFFSDFATHFFNQRPGMGNRTDLIFLFPTRKFGGVRDSSVVVRAFDTNENAVSSISPLLTVVFPDELNIRALASLGVPDAVTEGWVQIAFADGTPALGFVLNNTPAKTVMYFPAAKGSIQAPGRIGRAQ